MEEEMLEMVGEILQMEGDNEDWMTQYLDLMGPMGRYKSFLNIPLQLNWTLLMYATISQIKVLIVFRQDKIENLFFPFRIMARILYLILFGISRLFPRREAYFPSLDDQSLFYGWDNLERHAILLLHSFISMLLPPVQFLVDLVIVWFVLNRFVRLYQGSLDRLYCLSCWLFTLFIIMQDLMLTVSYCELFYLYTFLTIGAFYCLPLEPSFDSTFLYYLLVTCISFVNFLTMLNTGIRPSHLPRSTNTSYILELLNGISDSYTLKYLLGSNWTSVIRNL